ncbi:MAG: 4-hydroxythreonine-4-phosphate dehydrogenase PdxA [Pseudomonadota bacterium]
MARIGMMLGDPAGVGPEVVAKVLSANRHVPVALFADPGVFARAQAIAGVSIDVEPVADSAASAASDALVTLIEVPLAEGESLPPGIASAQAGRHTLASLQAVAAATAAGHVNGILYGPLNKQAMKLAGHHALDEMHYFQELLNWRETCFELINRGPLWTTRVTSHIPMKEVAGAITVERILEATQIGVRAARAAGIAAPRIRVAALNPHAGEGGAMGLEEIEVLTPAVARMKADGFDVEGPFPADTIFRSALRGDADLIVTMYHDQGQIALKTVAFGENVTVLGGMPVPIVTSSQGTAFDIVGQNKADPSALQHAFDLVVRLAGVGPAWRGEQVPA